MVPMLENAVEAVERLEAVWLIATPRFRFASQPLHGRGLEAMGSQVNSGGFSQNRCRRPPVDFKTADEQASRGVAYDLYRHTQKQLLSTPFVLIAALRDPKLAAKAGSSRSGRSVCVVEGKHQSRFPR